MKATFCFLAAALFLIGCASSNVAKRKQERPDVYASLSPEHKALVDSGQIKIGMPPDAVYLAWGKPSQIISGESAQGQTTTWLYHGTYLEEYRYWTYRSPAYRGGFYASPYLEHDYFPRGYVSAQVFFEKGVVKEWRSLPRPAS